jgi:polyhydroxyalkanoate synthesis regulator phasin
MTPEQHRIEAEARLDAAYRIARPESGHSDEDAMRLIGIALQRGQVHATLALAASDERIAGLEERIRKLEEADEADGLADRIEAIERRLNGEVPW